MFLTKLHTFQKWSDLVYTGRVKFPITGLVANYTAIITFCSSGERVSPVLPYDITLRR